MNTTWAKVTVAILLGLLRFVSGILPFKLYTYLKIWQEGRTEFNSSNKRQHYVECCVALVQAFGGGVLFATCFLHMMPEVYHAIHELEHHASFLTKYPFSQFIICMGFFMVYFVEEIAQYSISKMPEKAHHADASEDPMRANSAKNKISPTPDGKAITIQETDFVNQKKVSAARKKSVSADSIKDSVDSGLDKSEEDLNRIPVNLPTSEEELILEIEKSPKRTLRCILITLALSFHAVFEGIAIGLQHSVSNIWYIFIAISIHSITLLFCVGVELLFSNKSKTVIFIFVFTLSVTSPVGILIGLAVTSSTNEGSFATATASALLEGLSAGTMLYITFFEVLNREKEKNEYKFNRGICIIVGFSAMAFLQLLE